MDRVKMFKDRKDQIKFVYDTGKMVSERVLSTNTENQKFIDLVAEVAKMCEDYPENDYGHPCVLDVMCQAFRHINYELGNIQLRDDTLKQYKNLSDQQRQVLEKELAEFKI